MYLCKGWENCFNCFSSRLGQCANSSVSSAFSFLPDTATNTSNHVVMEHVDSVNSPSDSLSSESEHAPPSFHGFLEAGDPHDSLLQDGGRLHEARSSATVHDIIKLPLYEAMAEPLFVWGPLDEPSCGSIIDICYSEPIHCRIYLFRIPLGKVGESFIRKLTRLFTAYATASALESVALKASFLFPILVLKHPSYKLKSKEIICLLHCRLSLWQEGSFKELLTEGNAIQAHLRSSSKTSKDQVAHTFANLMMAGKVGSAIRILSQKSKGQILSLDSPAYTDQPSRRLVWDILCQKHPSPGPVHSDGILLNDPLPPDHDPHSIIFDQIDGELIRRTGPSGVDAASWKRF